MRSYLCLVKDSKWMVHKPIKKENWIKVFTNICQGQVTEENYE